MPGSSVTRLPQRNARLVRAIAAAAFAFIPSWMATAAEDDRRPPGTNAYLAGASVYTEHPIAGDLVAAAGRIRVDHPVGGDAVLAAGSIEVNGRIGDDLRAAGGIVSVSGAVAGEALLLGGSVALGPESEVSERTWIAGDDVIVGGRLHGGLKVYARTILILGTIAGNVDLSAQRIEILGSARVLGDLTYSSRREITIDPGATVAGSIVRAPETFEIRRPAFGIPGWQTFRPLFLLGLLAAGMLLAALFPRFIAAALQAVDASPLKSLGLGTAIFFSVPPVILLLIITIIGIPIAFALLALYATALLTAYLVAALYIGARLLRIARRDRAAGRAWHSASLAAALLLLWAARQIPYAGALVIILALVAGMGAIVLQAFSRYSDRP